MEVQSECGGSGGKGVCDVGAEEWVFHLTPKSRTCANNCTCASWPVFI